MQKLQKTTLLWFFFYFFAKTNEKLAFALLAGTNSSFNTRIKDWVYDKETTSGYLIDKSYPKKFTIVELMIHKLSKNVGNNHYLCCKTDHINKLH